MKLDVKALCKNFQAWIKSDHLKSSKTKEQDIKMFLNKDLVGQGVKWVVVQKITLRLFPSICCSRNDRLKNKAQDVVDGMTALISGDNQLKNVLHRAWTCFGLSSTAKRQITKVISRVAGGWNPDALVDSLLVRQLTRWKKGISSSDDSGVMNAP